jgi:hypothetical protein
MAFPNITIGGGTEFNTFLAEMLRQLGEQRLGRAGVAQDLFSQLFGAQIEANRRPISFVDQLMLSGEVGNVFPFSQAGSERLARFRTPPRTDLVRRLMDRLDIFSRGALTEQEQQEETIRSTPGLQGALSSFGQGTDIGDIFETVQGFAHGGTMTVDPKKKTSTKSTVAGPISIFDKQGQPVAVAGEGGQQEVVSFEPIRQPIRRDSVAPPPSRPQGGGIDLASQALAGHPRLAGRDVVLTRDEKFRLDELLAQKVSFDEAVNIARNPGQFEAFIGQQSDPFAVASRALSSALAGDTRFSDPFVRALALGRQPAPGVEATTRDLSLLPRDLLEALQSIVGPDNFGQYLFELGNLTPRGTRTSTVGGVRLR